MSPVTARANAEKITTKAVMDLKATDNDMTGEQAAYLVMRSAALALSVFRGRPGLAKAARAIADEFERS